MSVAAAAIDLRAGSIADLATVDALMRAAFDPRYGEAWTLGQCTGVMAMPGVWLTLATVASAPAGFALCRQIVDEAELLLLAVRPDLRRRGIGNALLRAVMVEARARDVGALHLEVRANNDAMPLYIRTGFAKVGERRGYYRGRNGKLFDALTLRRDLR